MIENRTLGSKMFDVIHVFLMIICALLCIVPVWYVLCVSLSSKCHNSRPVSFLQRIFPEQSAYRHQAESQIYQLAIDKRLRRTGCVADYYHFFGISSERLIRKHIKYSNQKKRPFKKALIL